MKTIIIDDETPARMALRQEINWNCPQLDIVAEADDVESGVTAILHHQPELIFLDIQLKNGFGFDILEQMHDRPFKIIFTTAYSEYAIKAIKFSAFDYLLKPVDGEELVKAIDKLEKTSLENFNVQVNNFFNNLKRSNPSKKIAINAADGLHLFALDDIVRCSSDGNYSFFHFVNGKKIITAKTLKEVEALVADFNFERIHKSHIVNLNHITSYLNKDKGCVLMSDLSEVPVSQRKKARLLGILNSYNA